MNAIPSRSESQASIILPSMAPSLDRRELLRIGALAALPWAAARAADDPIRLPARVRLGLLGLEGHYSEALNAVRDYPAIEIVALETLSDEQERKASGIPELATATRYRDYRRLLDAEDLDAVCVCDQNWRRAESVAACLERGIPTAAEKPIAVSVEQLEAVEQAAARTKTPLTMLLIMRYLPEFVAMKEIVASGAIGDPIQLSGQKSYKLGNRPEWMKDRRTFGGTIPYIGCHVVDLLSFITGRDMTHASGFHANVGAPQIREMENTCAISYRLDNGGTADIRLDYLRPQTAPTHGDDRIRIAGTKGVIEYQQGKVTLADGDGPPREITERPQTRTLLPDFLDAVFNGGSPMLTQQELFRVSRIVLRTRDAVDAGELVKI